MWSDLHAVLITGASGVGKSALGVRFWTGSYLEHYDPTNEDIYRKSMHVDDETAHFELLELPREVDYVTIKDEAMKRADGVMVVYSVTDRASFEQVHCYRQQVLDCRAKQQLASVPMLLIACKCDVTEEQRAVTTKEGENLARALGIRFFEVSAKAGVNVEEVFAEIVRQSRKLRRGDVQTQEKCVIY